MDQLPPSPPAIPQPDQSAQNRESFRKLALPILIGGQVADGWSTADALGRAGTHEANGVYGSSPSLGRIVGTKAAIGVPVALGLDHLAGDHPNLAKLIAILYGGVGATAAAHNWGSVGK